MSTPDLRPRHWLILACALVFVVGVVVASLTTSSTPRAMAQEAAAEPATPSGPVTPLSEAEYRRVAELRQHLALEAADLAAMGLTQNEAEAVLGEVLNWTRANRALLDAADRGLAQSRAGLRRAYRAIHTGPRDEAVIRSVPRLRDALDQSRAQRHALIDQLAAAVSPRLSAPQQAVWSTARTNRDAPARYRYTPHLHADDKRALSSRHRDQAEARLSFTQRDAMGQARQRQTLRLPGVALAEAIVLPAPPSITGEPDPAGTPEPRDVDQTPRSPVGP